MNQRTRISSNSGAKPPTDFCSQRISKSLTLREPVVTTKTPGVRESRYYHSCNRMVLLNVTIIAPKVVSAPQVRVTDQQTIRPVNTYKAGSSPR